MHQYLWSQYVLDRPDEVALDFGGAFVVNLYPLSMSADSFGFPPGSSELHSVLFQKAVCFAHANGGSTWPTLEVLHAVAASHSTGPLVVASPGAPMELAHATPGWRSGSIAWSEVHLDASLCFGPLEPRFRWRGRLSRLFLRLSGASDVAGLQLLVVRPRPLHDEGPMAPRAVFDVLDIQDPPLPGAREPHRLGAVRPATGVGSGNLQTATLNFSQWDLSIAEGSCLAWRGAAGPAFVSIAGPTMGRLAAQLLPAGQGTWNCSWRAAAGGGSRLDCWDWLPRAHLVVAEAEILSLTDKEFGR